MIVFVGKQEKGFFVENKDTVSYVNPALYIEEQTKDILAYKEQTKVIIYDIEQYADEAQNIISWMLKIQEALGVKTIIFAPGYSPKSTLIKELYDNGIKNFIFSVYLGEQKEDLDYCLSGYFENFGYKEKRGITFEEEDVEIEVVDKEKIKTICVGIAGCIGRMGTTTQALQLVKYLQYCGYTASYLQMNNHGFVEALKDAYEEVEVNDDIGSVTYAKVDMYYQINKLQEILKKNYDYIIFDYGVYGENGYNKISFLEKEIQIFVVGSKPGGEFEKTYEVIKNNFYNNVHYIFNFVAKSEQEDVQELMAEKAEVTFFAPEARDPFIFSGDTELYSQILSLEPKNAVTNKKRRFFERRKKND